MLAKWFGNIDFGKWALNTSSGFVVTTAVLFIIDSFVPGHMTEYLFSDLNAGKIIVFGLAALVSAGILGLMIDCIYHSFGRWYAEVFWGPLEYVKRWRKILMRNLGFTPVDFEWMYAGSTCKLTNSEVEKDYLRFTEVAGSMGYTMALLFSPAAYLFLRLEYHQTSLLSLIIALLVAVGGLILLATNAASLRKYESRKNTAVLQYIRSSNTRIDIDTIDRQCKEELLLWHVRQPISDKDSLKIKRLLENKKAFQNRLTPRSWFFLVIVVISGVILSLSVIAANHRLTEETQMANMNVIGAAENITAENKGVPTLDIVVNKRTGDTPGISDQAKSIAIIIKELSHSNTEIALKDADPVTKNSDLIKLLGIPDVMKPKWELTAYLFNTSNVTDGDRVYVNVLLSFKGIPASDIFEGEWLFPIIVQSGGKDYILAQVHVKINPAAPAAGNGEDENAGKTDSSTVAAKNDSKKA